MNLIEYKKQKITEFSNKFGKTKHKGDEAVKTGD